MILKDAFCSECGREMEVYVEFSQETETEEFCPLCNDVQIFHTKCNGGKKSRWRMNDWDGYNPKGCIETLETKAEHYPTKWHADNDIKEDLPHKDGGKVIDKFNRTKEEKEDKFRYKFNKKRNKTPIRFDMKKTK